MPQPGIFVLYEYSEYLEVFQHITLTWNKTVN